jgi:16S rRNA (guanine527-N7)-methyltransferase
MGPQGVFHVKHEGWAALSDLGVPLAPQQISLLERYEEFLVERGAPMGMIAPSDVPRLRERHVLDSLRAVPILPPATATMCDLGSGAGLPGIPLAIALPDVQVTLVEVRHNRAAFLETVIGALGLESVTVHARRLETFRTSVDVCLARAFAPAPNAWEAAERLLDASGMLVYWAGATFDPEADVPLGVDLALFPTSALARSGPLAIMTRQ